MEIKGTITNILPSVSGMSKAGKEFTKQDFVIQTKETYPKKICITAMNDKVNISNYTEGSEVTVSVNIESREYNGNWYTSVNAWKIEANN